MHVTSVASDLLKKHMYRINQDYKLILLNNEIPQSIRIGPLNHPAMINDTHTTSSSSTTSTGNGTGGGGGITIIMVVIIVYKVNVVKVEEKLWLLESQQGR